MGELTIYRPCDISTSEKLAMVRMDSNVPHYRNVPRNRRIEWLIEKIAQLNLMLHHKGDGQVFEMDAIALDSYISDDIYINDLTMQEIDEAFKMGLIGKYGEFYGINAVTLFQFLLGYFKSEKKQKAIKLVQEAQKRAKREQYEKDQREKARLEGWGVEMKTVTEADIKAIMGDFGKIKRDEDKARKSAEHRELIKQQVEQIRKTYEK